MWCIGMLGCKIANADQCTVHLWEDACFIILLVDLVGIEELTKETRLMQAILKGQFAMFELRTSKAIIS